MSGLSPHSRLPLEIKALMNQLGIRQRAHIDKFRETAPVHFPVHFLVRFLARFLIRSWYGSRSRFLLHALLPEKRTSRSLH